MSDLAHNKIALTCPSCGAKLTLVDSIQLLVCASCGNEHIVRHSGAAIYLAPMAQDVRQIGVSADKTAAELAVVRLTKELAAINDEITATKTRNYTNKIKPNPIMALLPIAALLTLAFFWGGSTPY